MLKKEFWKYFFTAYKNAKWLICRYMIVALYLTVTSIIANNMNLTNLTYFNAIIGLAAFGDLVGFGVSNGVGIFINQNINNKQKVNYYVKIGMYINILFSLLLVSVFAIFFKPILHNLFGLPTTINYTFYFIMLAYIFLNCILIYCVDTLKSLKMFLAEMFVAIIQCVLLISGFLLIWFKFDIALNFISILYIFTSLCALIFIVIYFNYNKYFKINLFKLVKMKFVKSEAIIMWRMAAMQIVWQVGYSILAYFMLKVSDVYFNQYAYLENVLDIFNGLFFSFVTITGIDICRKLGEGNFDEAYKIGKYSLIATVIIWVAYFILSLAFSVSIIKGMSIDIQTGAITAIILYVLMHLFRFLSWNLTSYILCWGGESTKVIVLQEILISVYYIVFYFLAPFLPENIYLVYAIITLPAIVQTVWGLAIFKGKKWMKKLSEENEIKVVVFDFDDTLYSGLDWTVWEDFCRKGLREIFKDLDDKEFLEVQTRFENNGATDEEIINELILQNRDINEWLNYRDNHSCKLDFSNCKKTDEKVLKEFADKYVLYIVSNSTKKDIEETAKQIGLDLSIFKEIVINQFQNKEKSKKALYNSILKKENITADEMFVIGNSLEFDIQPAFDIGASGKQIESADFEITDFNL